MPQILLRERSRRFALRASRFDEHYVQNLSHNPDSHCSSAQYEQTKHLMLKVKFTYLSSASIANIHRLNLLFSGERGFHRRRCWRRYCCGKRDHTRLVPYSTTSSSSASVIGLHFVQDHEPQPPEDGGGQRSIEDLFV